jgi:3,4-dihydroxy 2-butanone 4-phosphate synthase/GTP cyclohydrolase II
MNDDGTMARMPDLEKFADRHGLKIATVRDIIAYRMRYESFVHKVAETHLPTPFGEFKIMAFLNDLDQYEHLALVKGEVDGERETLVRVHSQCTTGDVFGSFRCDCGTQLQRAMEMVQEEGEGVILYMQQEGRGIGLANKIKAYALQDKGRDTVEANRDLGFEADLRDYGVGAQILAALGVRKIRLMTNNPRKIRGLEGYGLEIVGRVPIETEPKAENLKYLMTKCQKLGHLLKISEKKN